MKISRDRDGVAINLTNKEYHRLVAVFIYLRMMPEIFKDNECNCDYEGIRQYVRETMDAFPYIESKADWRLEDHDFWTREDQPDAMPCLSAAYLAEAAKTMLRLKAEREKPGSATKEQE